MQCMPLEAKTIIQKSPVIFIGKVTAIEASDYDPMGIYRNGKPDNCGAKIVTFAVSSWLQGQPQSTTEQTRVLIEDACYYTGPYVNDNQLMFIAAQPNTTDYPAELFAFDVCYGSGNAFSKTSLVIQHLLKK